MTEAHQLDWSSRYVGIPFTELGRDPNGYDCWGLLIAVYRQELAIDLPSYTGDMSRFERAEVAEILKRAQASLLWQKVGAAKPFDVLVFRRGRLATHVGVAIDRRQMLHIDERQPSHITRFDRTPWSHCLTGIYRHSDRMPS